MPGQTDIDQLAVNTIRILAVDAVQKALASGVVNCRPRAVCCRVRAGQGRLYPGRCAGRQTRRDPDRQRQRSVALPGSPRVAYRDSVLPPSITARVTVEEGPPIGWDRFAGLGGVVLGMRSFGLSAPMKMVAEHFGFTAKHVVAAAREAFSRVS